MAVENCISFVVRYVRSVVSGSFIVLQALELRGLGVELFLQLYHIIVLDAGLRLDVFFVFTFLYRTNYLSEPPLPKSFPKLSIVLQSFLES